MKAFVLLLICACAAAFFYIVRTRNAEENLPSQEKKVVLVKEKPADVAPSKVIPRTPDKKEVAKKVPVLPATPVAVKNEDEAKEPVKEPVKEDELVGMSSLDDVVVDTGLKMPVASVVKPAMIQNFVRGWEKKYAKKINLGEWSKLYPSPPSGWFGDNDEVASNWFFTIGPIGARVHPHDFTWSSLNSFKALYPEIFRDVDGDLVYNVMEVKEVISGSPADGFLKEGDLIVGMQGTPLLSASALTHRLGEYQHQAVRGLEMHVGELMNDAEGQGKISFDIIRPSEIKTKPAPLGQMWKKGKEELFSNEASKKSGFVLNEKLSGGQMFRLVVTDGGNGKGSDGFSWENMYLTNGSKKVFLHELRPIGYSVGHGGAAVDKEKGNWQAHAPSSISFELPKGKEWLLKGRGMPNGGASVTAYIETRAPMDIPAGLKQYVKKVTFPVQPIGSYREGYPKDSPKSEAVVDMTASWLAAQQNEDGSWDRPAGYTRAMYDTATAGIALMATGDKKYDAVIKKAAYFCGFSGTQDWWAVPLSHSTIFMCEYYLRYKDKEILQPIYNNTRRLINEMLYGDYTSGHGKHPGYRGTGVSVGGSHMTLALVMAYKTGVPVDKSIIDKMLIRAQEISPRGVTPYGRDTSDMSTDPDLKSGATYSGRHGPYLVASYIHGGAKNFVKNCSALYSHGALGGGDQGHSTETLSVLWQYPASAQVGLPTYYRQMEANIWKITLQRAFDGGFIFNGNRNEYMGAEGVLNTYIRTSAWILALCADKQNLAITGKPEYRAKTFLDIPPTVDVEVNFLNKYKQNYALIAAAVGKKAPASVRSIIAKLGKIPVKPGCREQTLNVLKEGAMTAAKDLLALKLPNLLSEYCAEIALGIDTRITLDPTEGDKAIPGVYAYEVYVQHPFAGRSEGLRDQEERAAREPIVPFAASVTLIDEKGVFTGLNPVSVDSSKDKPRRETTEVLSTASTEVAKDAITALKAKIAYKIGDLSIAYERPILANASEPGNGEKSRKIVNDRKILVPGILAHDHGYWGISFRLPSGQWISAATQGNEVTVTNKEKKTWVSPTVRSLTADSKCRFHVTTGWFGAECRIAQIDLLAEGVPILDISEIRANNKQIPVKGLDDMDMATTTAIPFQDKCEIVVTLKKTSPIRAVDIRAAKSPFGKMTIEVEKSGRWEPLHWSSFNGEEQTIRDFNPVSGSKVKIILEAKGSHTLNLSEIFIYGPIKPISTRKPAV